MKNSQWGQSDHHGDDKTQRSDIQLSTAEIAVTSNGSSHCASDLARSSLNRVHVFRKQILLPFQAPITEDLTPSALQSVLPRTSLGMLPMLALTNALGLLMISISYYLSVLNYGNNVLESLFLPGLLLMFLPNLLRLLSSSASRVERMALLCVLGTCFYCVYFMTSPQHAFWFDEFLHWRTVADILRSGHLFSENAMLPASPYYPGLEVVTDAISTMTGLNAFYAGVIVINMVRILTVFSLFLLYEQVTKSSRMAGIAVIIYMANPHFLLFDALFSYETLALPLATFFFYLLIRFEPSSKNPRGVLVIAWVVLMAITLSHHMTDYVSVGLLSLWAGISWVRPTARATRIYLTALALFGITIAVSYAFLLPGNPVWGYLSEYFGGAFIELGHILARTGTIRPLFESANLASPIWDRLLMTASVVVITCCLPFGLLYLIRKERNSAFPLMLGLFSLVYPVTQAFRFTEFGSEITDRAAAFLFLPLAYVLTLLITYFWLQRKLKWKATVLISSAFAIIVLGSVIVELGTVLSALPGPYLVSADGRSVEPEGIDAATWSLSELGTGNRMATDRINQMLMSTYGDQRIITHLEDNVDISPIFFSAQLGTYETSLIQYFKIRYLVVDLRLSASLPLNGFYFEGDQPTSPITREGLTKFEMLPQMDRLFDSGNIIIYSTGVSGNGSG